MTTNEQDILDRVNADDWELLYRCRWSQSDAEHVVPQLATLLESEDILVVNEALRALFRIGTPAEPAGAMVAQLTCSEHAMTKQLAVLTLGSIAHKAPTVCVEPLAQALTDPLCCRDAMRTLAFLGAEATGALERVREQFASRDAKIRKAAVVTATEINGEDPETAELLRKATADRSKIVREAATKCLRKIRRD